MRVASLVLLFSSVAIAEPSKQPPPLCPVEGPVVFTIDHRTDPGATVDTSRVELHANGSFHWLVTTVGKTPSRTPGPTGNGCLPKASNDQVTAALKAAPWTLTHRRITCKARSVSFTVFSVNGKEVYTERVCGADALDAKSQAAIDLIVPLIDHAP